MSDPNLADSPKLAADLIPAVYEKLRRLANWKMSHETPQTLGATALVHEVWLKLSNAEDSLEKKWQNERHFFSAAAEAMRLILIDRARARKSVKRGGDHLRDDDALTHLPAPEDADEIIQIGEAVEAFAEVDPYSAELVKLKYFVGMQWEEIAILTGESTRNLRRHWAYARSWLHTHIQDNSQ